MNVVSSKQKFFGTGANKEANGHTDNIVSLGVCPNRKKVVTGSIGAKPAIIVWDSETMQVISRTNLGRNTRAVSTIRFSKDGKLFFCTDKHNDSNVYCF
jgi:WD40 repeat protein